MIWAVDFATASVRHARGGVEPQDDLLVERRGQVALDVDRVDRRSRGERADRGADAEEQRVHAERPAELGRVHVRRDQQARERGGREAHAPAHEAPVAEHDRRAEPQAARPRREGQRRLPAPVAAGVADVEILDRERSDRDDVGRDARGVHRHAASRRAISVASPLIPPSAGGSFRDSGMRTPSSVRNTWMRPTIGNPPRSSPAASTSRIFAPRPEPPILKSRCSSPLKIVRSGQPAAAQDHAHRAGRVQALAPRVDDDLHVRLRDDREPAEVDLPLRHAGALELRLGGGEEAAAARADDDLAERDAGAARHRAGDAAAGARPGARLARG